jgi:hypothetical protein
MSLIKKLIVIATMTISMSAVANSKEIFVVHSSPPGGNTEKVNRALSNELEKNGYQTKHEFVAGCHGIQKWVETNPGKPVVFDLTGHQAAVHIVSPDHNRGCKIAVTKQTLIAFSGKSSSKFCAMSDKVAQDWIKGEKNIKVGYNRTESSTQAMVEGFAKDVNPSTEFVAIKGSKALGQALASGDIQIATAAYSSNLEGAGAKCFLESHLTSKKTTMRIKEINSKTKWADAGLISMWVGFNVPVDEFRKYAIDAVKNDASLINARKLGAETEGIAAGKTVDEQYRVYEEFLKMFKN